ncbi:TonB-dependent receptor [Edaphosphingomonas haloaromaticamans]|uniref:Putative TonB-dependent receptor BfrD n=1 Tax=Edaphosphingomonas haloaromaticamans TaxID=653954 RepID=A0A1S1HE60_9SPHN|nr:TonB-dependent siderophore receptor [Sphingomonas haloaromaticamans]OHT18780.1 putative TonB-dependent receptor BfrD precursor [Sphingomonas haloaromaticamans]
MASSDFRSSVATPAFIALGCVGFIASAPAIAQSSGTAEGGKLGGVTVEAEAIEEGIKVDRVESPKATAPLLDTPQTITVISNQTIRQQNLLTLRDALSTIPGITFGAGEGGGGFGDSINLRGYSANNDITQDGVRDSGQYSRTDPFNLQQIEVYNGANSVFNGSGSVGGTINLVSKTPQANDLTVLEAGIGTDNYYRATVDSNVRASDLVAFRLNGMFHRNDYPDRDVEKYKRWGIAPSVTIGVDSPTRLTLSYVHQRDNNTPTYGVPFYITDTNDGPIAGIDSSDYYGIVNLDKQKITFDQATMRVDHDFSDAISVRNLTRWQRVEQYSVTSAPQGAICLVSGVQPNGQACPNGLAPGKWAQGGPRGYVRDQENQLFYNQTDLRIVSGEEGGIRNTLVVGGALTWEDYNIDTGSMIRNADGSAATLPQVDYIHPDFSYANPHYVLTARAKSHSSNKAIYAFDTVELGQFELNAGIRYEHNKGRYNNLPIDYPPGTTPLTPAQLATQRNSENLFSYRFGGVFKPTENTSIYIAYANSKTPSSATVRTGCGTISAPGAADPCAVAPEKARNYEIGAKADVLGGGLQLTAALFRNERSNFRVASNDPSLPATLQVLDGKSRVDGIALGATGRITEAWSIFANYTYLDSEVRQSISDFDLEQGVVDPQRGNRLTQTPKHSGSLWTTYAFDFGLQLGYGFTYQGSFATNFANANNPTQYNTDNYWVHRAMASYAFGNGLTAQLNVQNIFDKKYYTNIRNNLGANGVVGGGWAMPGEGRSARLSLFYSF